MCTFIARDPPSEGHIFFRSFKAENSSLFLSCTPSVSNCIKGHIMREALIETGRGSDRKWENVQEESESAGSGGRREMREMKH